MASQRREKIPAKSADNQEVLSVLLNLFGDVLHTDVIKSVALNCQWNLQTASNILAELTSSVSNNKLKKPETKPKKKISQPNLNRNAQSINSFSYGDQCDDADVVIEDETNTIFSAVNTLNYRQTFSETAKKKVVNTAPPKKNKPQQPPIQNKSKREIEFDRVLNHIRTGAKVLVILRGLPGSGKSYLAKLIVTSTINEDPCRFVYSTDEFFEKNGVYKFNPMLLQDAHAWNQRRVFEVMKMGLSPIIVDNTNTEMWEMKPYALFAVQFGYAVEILEPNTSWIFNAPELARRNTHGVPREKIAHMLERYEKNIKPSTLLKFFNLQYIFSNHPPQPRLYPPLSRNIPPLMAYMIPTAIARYPVQNTVTINEIRPINEVKITEVPPKPKKKRPRKKKNNTNNNNNNGQMSDSASTISKSESMHSILTNDSDSDIDSSHELSKNENGYSLNVRDVFHEKPEVNKSNSFYDLLATSNETSMKSTNDVEADDLINFNDIEDQDKTNNITELISIENKESESNRAKVLSQKTADLIDSCVRLFKEVTTKDTTNQNKNLLTEASATNSDYPKLDLTAWGLSDESLISWELVETPKAKIQPKQSDPQPQRDIFRQSSNELQSTESSTNTCSEDFALLKQDTTVNNPDVRILRAENRNISENYVSNMPRRPLKVAMLEKSTMTGEEERSFNVQDFSELKNLFPTVSRDVLKDIFEKCRGDVNWAVDLLLDGSYKDILTVSVDQSQIEISNEDPNMFLESLQPKETTTTTTTEPENQNVQIPENRKNINKFKNKTSDESLKLQQQLNEQFKINDNYYSEHVLNLRKKRHGELEPSPSTSKEEIIHNELNQNVSENESEASSEEDFIEMNVGISFIEELERTAGNVDLEYPKGFQPVVQLPVSLVRQLHAYWIESVYQQMEAQQKILEDMEREDVEFAKKLQEEESKTDENKTPVVPDLQEIMDMEIALAIYKADTEQWKNESRDDLASRLKRQKLFETFPNFDKGALAEILHSCGNSFEQTVEVIRASVDDGHNVNNRNENVEAMQKELIENAKQEGIEAKKTSTPIHVARNIAPEAIKKTATEYREEAQRHMEMREYNFQKAKEAMQKGQTQVALYYSEIARLHIKKYEQSNSLAAVAFLASQTKDSKTLDLHFLLGKEAEQAVSVFLDEQISRLKTINKQSDSIFIITGWGKHSKKGAVIKPMIMNKLRKRRLKFTQANPGLLKVNIHKNSLMTNDLNE